MSISKQKNHGRKFMFILKETFCVLFVLINVANQHLMSTNQTNQIAKSRIK